MRIFGVITWVLLFTTFGPPASTDPLTIATTYPPPYSRTDGTGILETILEEAAGRVGVEVIVKAYPAERALVDANAGLIDGDIARIDGVSELYPNLRIVPSSIIPSRDFVAFTRAHGPEIRTWSDLEHHNVTYVRGWKIIEQNTPPGTRALPVDSTELAFGLLARGRTDVVVNARLDGLAMAARLGIDDVRLHEPPLASRSLYVHLHAAHADLIPRLAETLEKLKADGTFGRVYAKAMAAYDDGAAR